MEVLNKQHISVLVGKRSCHVCDDNDVHTVPATIQKRPFDLALRHLKGGSLTQFEQYKYPYTPVG